MKLRRRDQKAKFSSVPGGPGKLLIASYIYHIDDIVILFDKIL